MHRSFAEYVAVPDVRYLVPSRSIPLEVACLLPCSGLTAYHALEEGLQVVQAVREMKGTASCFGGDFNMESYAKTLQIALTSGGNVSKLLNIEGLTFWS